MLDPNDLHHHPRPMGGRDPHQPHRTATPLELLFDLTFVIAFGAAASEYAHFVAEGHLKTGLLGFGFAAFAICWAWINFSWFASAYDTDDWVFRAVTMVQMIGVLVLAVGLPRMFASIERGDVLDNSVMVLGYVIMRIAMVSQWLRAAGQDPARRRACLTYAAAISAAQFGWVVLIFLDFSIAVTFAFAAILIAVEMAGPYLAERYAGGTPWHAHHIVERYGLFAIIALGEGVIGTVATLNAVVGEAGWNADAVLVGVAGTGLTFGMWWVYYIVPAAPVLHANRGKSFGWGYGQILVVAAIVATGAGLHVAAYFIEHKAHIGPVATVLCVAIPVGIYVGLVYALYAYLVGSFDRFHVYLLAGTFLAIAFAVLAAAAGLNMPLCLVIVMLAPSVTVVGYEIVGHRHEAEALSDELPTSL